MTWPGHRPLVAGASKVPFRLALSEISHIMPSGYNYATQTLFHITSNLTCPLYFQWRYSEAEFLTWKVELQTMDDFNCLYTEMFSVNWKGCTHIAFWNAQLTTNSNSIESRLPARQRGFEPRQVQWWVFLFSLAFRLVVGPNQPPVQWVPEVVTPEVKRPGREADRLPPCSAEVKKSWKFTSTPQYVFMALC